MRREFFLLPNANETQRSSATLSGMSGRQEEKGASSGRRQMQKIVFGNSFGDAGSEGILHTALCYILERRTRELKALSEQVIALSRELYELWSRG